MYLSSWLAATHEEISGNERQKEHSSAPCVREYHRLKPDEVRRAKGGQRPKKSEIESEGWINYLMEAEVVLDGVRAEEDDSLGGHHQHEAVEGLQTENKKFI